MMKGVYRNLQLTAASLGLLACALPEVTTWYPPSETMPADDEAGASEGPSTDDVEPETSTSSTKIDAGVQNNGSAAAGSAASTDSASAAPAASSGALPAAGSAAADSGSGSAGRPAMQAAPCACAAGAPCCDGCYLLPDGASCPFAGPAQCLEGGACQAGICSPKIKATFCLVSDECYRENQAAPRYDCLYCAPARAQDRFSPRPSGTACDDKVYCNGADRCGAYGQCTDSNGSPCPAGWSCEEVSESCHEPPPPSTARG